MSLYRRQHKVRFAETDYAGIMFYPRYFEALNATVEDWFADIAQCRFEDMLDEYDVGTPLVSVETRFIKPCRLGDMLTFTLKVTSIGKTSLTFEAVTSCGEETRMRATLTHVCVKRDISGAAPWPAAIHERLSAAMENQD